MQVLYKHVRGGGGGSEGNAYVIRGLGGWWDLEAKCLYCLYKGSKFLFP